MESAEGVEEQEPMEGLEKSEERAEEFDPIFALLFYHAAAAARCFRPSACHIAAAAPVPP